jgi:hypothetical protein
MAEEARVVHHITGFVPDIDDFGGAILLVKSQAGK